MPNRHKVIIALSIVLLTIIIFIAIVFATEPWLLSREDIAIHIVIDNRTNEPIGPFVISDKDHSEPLYINQIEPLSVMDVYFTKSGSASAGENAIVMTGYNGNGYSIVPYFENQEKGRIDIRVECVTPDGLSGKKRDLLLLGGSFEWRHWWGTSACK